MRPKPRTLTMALAALVASGGIALPARANHLCSDDSDATADLSALAVPGVTGKYALPTSDASPTKVLVAFAHGYGHRSDSWVTHMQRTAALGAIAFATDYRGQGPAPENRGWRVSEGAEDTIAVAKAFMAMCTSINKVILYGVSMGGNTSGLAIAAQAKRASGSALFDYWVAGEPVANIIEEYLLASAAAPVSSLAANAKADMEEEMGGTLADKRDEYLKRTVVARIADIAASGVRGVAIVHGFDDGLVPYNQARELAGALRAAGIPTDMYDAARRETKGTPDGSDNTTLSENVARPLLGAAGQPYNEPLAGHGTESSQTNIVIQTGLKIVFDLIEERSAPGNHEFVVDGEAGTIKLI